MIASIFQRLEFIEKRGSGIVKMINAVRKIENVEFYSDRSSFITTFKNMNYDNDELKEMIDQKLDKDFGSKVGSKKTILNLIKQNTKITRKEINQLTKMSIISIDPILLYLKQNNIIKRIVSNRNGYWKILKELKGSLEYKNI
ncbi:MAG: hypothetical protein RSB76_00095 [Clostridia bacterium]